MAIAYSKILRPVLAEDRRLAHQGQFLFLLPLEHILRGACFQTSRRSSSFYINYFVFPLYEGADEFHTSYSNRVYPPGGTWDPSMAGFEQIFRDKLLNDIIPRVEPVSSPERFLHFLTNTDFNFPVMRETPEAYSLAAMGEYGRAIEIVSGWIPRLLERRADFAETRRLKLLATLKNKMEHDADSVPDFLREIEAFAVKQFKIEKYWRPTTFPSELKASERKPNGAREVS